MRGAGVRGCNKAAAVDTRIPALFVYPIGIFPDAFLLQNQLFTNACDFFGSAGDERFVRVNG